MSFFGARSRQLGSNKCKNQFEGRRVTGLKSAVNILILIHMGGSKQRCSYSFQVEENKHVCKNVTAKAEHGNGEGVTERGLSAHFVSDA
jgi:hypothetical protein